MIGVRPKPPPARISKPSSPLCAAHDVHADVVHQRCGAIVGRPGHGNLELARQVAEFGMKRRPLPDDLAPGARILDFVRRDARKVIRGDVADAVAAGLDGVHLDRRELGQNVRHVLELRPVVLNDSAE